MSLYLLNGVYFVKCVRKRRWRRRKVVTGLKYLVDVWILEMELQIYCLSSRICIGATFKHMFFSARFSLYKRLVFKLYTTRFNNKNFIFCLQNLFMWSVFISKRTAIISIYNTDWLVFKPEAESVYCAVRPECYIYSRFFSVLKGSETALCFKEARVQSGGSPYGSVVE